MCSSETFPLQATESIRANLDREEAFTGSTQVPQPTRTGNVGSPGRTKPRGLGLSRPMTGSLRAHVLLLMYTCFFLPSPGRLALGTNEENVGTSKSPLCPHLNSKILNCHFRGRKNVTINLLLLEQGMERTQERDGRQAQM